MIDLTPLDVRKKRGDFKRGLRGYDLEEVDSFLELVAERMEELVRQNLMLAERVERLDEQVRSQVGREQAVNEALVTAQQLRTDISGQAQREADTLRSNAEAEARAMADRARSDAQLVRREVEQEIDAALRDAARRLSEAQEALEGLERNRARFLKSFRSLLEREVDGVEVEEGRSALDLPTLDLDLLGGRTGAEIVESAPLEEAAAEFAAPSEVETPLDAEAGPHASAVTDEGAAGWSADNADHAGQADDAAGWVGGETAATPDPMESWTTPDSTGDGGEGLVAGGAELEGSLAEQSVAEEPADGDSADDDGAADELDVERAELEALAADLRERNKSAEDLSAELDDLFSGADSARTESDEQDSRPDRAGFRLEDGNER